MAPVDNRHSVESWHNSLSVSALAIPALDGRAQRFTALFVLW
jgi:hypothetical protein